MTEPPLTRGPDGRFHPRTEAEVAALVRFAAAHGRRLRVRGAGHAPRGTVAVDDAGDLRVILDEMRGLRVVDEAQRIVEAQAGIHLGSDPASGPAGALENSLLSQLADRHGWTLSTTGGITHQALGGYLATASAGGTLQHSVLDQVVSVTFVDGRGEVRVVSRDDESPGLDAVLPSLGLLGVIVAVQIRCEPLFTIAGQESIVDLEHAAIDLTGPGRDGRPSLAAFLTDAEYARIEWWPQRGAERLLIWQAQRTSPQPGFRRHGYEEFTAYPVLAEAVISALLLIFGNLEDLERTPAMLRRNAEHISEVLDAIDAAQPPSRIRVWVRRVLPPALRALARITPRLGPTRSLLRRSLPRLLPSVLDYVLPFDSRKPAIRRNEPQSFHDWGWQGLPMDNQASDVLLASEFSELWVPLGRSEQVIGVLRDYFAEPEHALDSYHRSGLFAYELYGAPAATGWLHPGHSDGEDEWRDGSLRLDVYWFADNAEDPRDRFFVQFWALLRDHEIPFRLHWGKQHPYASAADPGWTELLASRYPRWEDFLALRAELDPDDVFLTEYWRARLGVWPPGPRTR
jgi:FAD/FMN-containing dehydrogenase